MHTQEVASYARLIAAGEGMAEDEIALHEIAAWLHDIGCPRSKEIYGNSLPQNQQSVGREVAAGLLANVDSLSHEQKFWLVDVVGSHHQFKSAQELHFEPLFEADLIVNILSGYYPKESAEKMFQSMMKTD
ncbi:MAG: HD domain-containing protein, partial [Rikenellaceae bacterium]